MQTYFELLLTLVKRELSNLLNGAKLILTSSYFQTKQSSEKLFLLTQDGAATSYFKILKEHLKYLVEIRFKKVEGFFFTLFHENTLLNLPNTFVVH